MFFHALTFAGSRGSCLNMRPQGQVFKDLPRDPANVNAMKQTCVIVILAFKINLPDSNLKSHQEQRKNIKIIVFCMLELFVQDGISMQNRT